MFKNRPQHNRVFVITNTRFLTGLFITSEITPQHFRLSQTARVNLTLKCFNFQYLNKEILNVGLFQLFKFVLNRLDMYYFFLLPLPLLFFCFVFCFSQIL